MTPQFELHSAARVLPITNTTDVAEQGRSERPYQRALAMFSLVFAGEAIFGLPFHVSRYFRPTYVEVFEISHTQLGVLGSIYGFVSMFAYLLGGGLADRVAPRGLLVFSLLITGASGFYMATIPDFPGMCGLFAFWGVATILPFWSALIRATREWGGHEQQGVA
ncbi:MAG: MFS transporter, partial [Planctomycetota bacterium]